MAFGYRGARRSPAIHVRRAATSTGLAAALLVAACDSKSDDPCYGIACSSRGFCIVENGQPYCACMTGFHPVSLGCVNNDPADSCVDVLCSGHGTCRGTPDGAVCDCAPGYHLLGLDDPRCAYFECDLVCVPNRPGEHDADAHADADADVEADVGFCGNRVVDPGEDCDGEPPHACTTSCASTGTQACSACAWGPCLPPTEACDRRDDDCDTVTDEECGTTVGTPCTGDAACTEEGLVCNESWGICVLASCTGQPDFQPCETTTSPDRSYDICVRESCVSPGCGDAGCNSPGPNFPLGDTGQRICYDNTAVLAPCPGTAGMPECGTTAFCGQDAQVGWDAGHAATERFTNTGTAEPVVTDGVTGLVWQGCTAGLTGSSCDGTTVDLTWDAALAYCDSLAWGGLSDWRLPDEYELLSLLDFDVIWGGRIEETAFPGTPPSSYWTSSWAADSVSEDAWYIHFSHGFQVWMAWYPNVMSVRCVRGGRPAAPRFSRSVVAGDPVVTDAATGLVWQGCPAGMIGDAFSCTGTAIASTWQVALGYCQNLDWAGDTDWYLPNIDELFGLRDNSRWSPSIAPRWFPGTPPAKFWSSTTSVDEPAHALNVHFEDGEGRHEGDKTIEGYVRCVRIGP